MNTEVTIEGTMTERETVVALYLARISMWHDAPEVPTIGGMGAKSKAITTSMVFHLYIAGRLAPRRPGLLRRLRCWFQLLSNRWKTLCSEEPHFDRHYRPTLFPLIDPEE